MGNNIRSTSQVQGEECQNVPLTQNWVPQKETGGQSGKIREETKVGQEIGVDKYEVAEENGNESENENNPENGNDEVDCGITIATKDDVDNASIYSFLMEKDFRYYFQHPYCRLAIAYLVVFCNFLIYAEDPVAHSIKECSIPVIGNDFAFVCMQYPLNAWSLLKVVLWFTSIILGMIVGKLLIHKLLFNRIFRLKMFRDDQGSWMTMFMCCILMVFIGSWLYNGFLMIRAEFTEPYRISSLMDLSNSIIMKAAACGTWCGDFFTAWMVTDIMLQEQLYPRWATRVRAWWKKGYNRIILFWIIVVLTSFIVVFQISMDYIQWDTLNRDFLPSNELSRTFLACFILVMDLTIVMQDWDFPHFLSAIDIKLPGLNTAHINFKIPKCLKREHWTVHITGKWFNYGILFIVIILDLNMLKNQVFYVPFDYGQYTDQQGRIYTVLDQESIDTFNETQLTYDYRNATIKPSSNQTYISSDIYMNSRYYQYDMGVKGIGFIPCLVTFITFGILIWMFGRFKPTEKDPYAGRLKKRRKKRKLSFKIPWRRQEYLQRKIDAVPELLAFKKGDNSQKVDEEVDVPDSVEVQNNEEILEEKEVDRDQQN